MKRIPGLIIGGKRLEGVMVAVPQVETETNLLGLNVIEMFEYHIDTAGSKIYYSLKQQNAIPEQLSCRGVYLI